VHGMSALPGIKWYTKQIKNLDKDAPELQEAIPVSPGGDF